MNGASESAGLSRLRIPQRFTGNTPLVITLTCFCRPAYEAPHWTAWLNLGIPAPWAGSSDQSFSFGPHMASPALDLHTSGCSPKYCLRASAIKPRSTYQLGTRSSPAPQLTRSVSTKLGAPKPSPTYGFASKMRVLRFLRRQLHDCRRRSPRAIPLARAPARAGWRASVALPDLPARADGGPRRAAD